MKASVERIEEFKIVHGDRYEYPEPPGKAKDKFNVLCKEHGLFSITVDSHRSGAGCSKCSRKRVTELQLMSFEDNVADFKKVHGDRYLYNHPTGTNSQKFIVTCKVHGDFLIAPNGHKSGRGCSKCARENQKGGWRNEDWSRSAAESEYFDSYKVYIIRCFDLESKEEFIKIGKTYRKVKDRFPSKSTLPYDYKIIKEIVFQNAQECTTFENKMHTDIKEFRYTPLKYFKGLNECFNMSVCEYIYKTLSINET